MRPGNDLLELATWECARTEPGRVEGPSGLAPADLSWFAFAVPGTVAAALRTLGQWSWGDDDEALLDGGDWWFRTEVIADGGPAVLDCDGLATICDLWVAGKRVLHSENMWRRHRVEVDLDEGRTEIALRCSALLPLLRQRRPRPRWRSRLIRHQNLRWYRTALVGRIDGWAWSGAPVGPWRPIRLLPRAAPCVVERRIHPRLVDGVGQVDARLRIADLPPGAAVELTVEGSTTPLEHQPSDDAWTAQVAVPSPVTWWPHTHGEPRLYDVSVSVDGDVVDTARIGFRDVRVDRTDDGFTVEVNGVPVFCRGVLWSSGDPISLSASPEELRRSLGLLKASGANMVRFGGYTHYPPPELWELCDELGVLVWQDCMLASFDPPEDEAWRAELSAELEDVFGDHGHHPCFSVVAGSSETYQQAAMFGVPPASCTSEVLEHAVPATLVRFLPDVPYVASAPSGGIPAFTPSKGVAHYFGVGAFLRPPDDVRLAGVRFAGECLAFATPPEPSLVEAAFGGSSAAGHQPGWKRTVARDPGTSWDFEDVVNHYVRTLFGVDPLLVRMADPDKALDLARAVVCQLMAGTFGEWRRAGSPCAGGLVLTWQDQAPGAGWGIVDAAGHPKAPWWALRRLWSPRAVWITDEGVADLHVHVANDRAEPLDGAVQLAAVTADGLTVHRGERPLSLPAATTTTLSSAELLDGYRDLSGALHFGVPPHDVVVATLTDGHGHVLSSATHALSHVDLTAPRDLGLRGRLQRTPDGWAVEVTTEVVAHWVAIEVDGWIPEDNWRTLTPGVGWVTKLVPSGDAEALPSGYVRALNSQHPTSLERPEEER